MLLPHRFRRPLGVERQSVRAAAAVHLHADHAEVRRQLLQDEHPEAVARRVAVQQHLRQLRDDLIRFDFILFYFILVDRPTDRLIELCRMKPSTNLCGFHLLY